MKRSLALGLDVGGSSIKYGLVATADGTLVGTPGSRGTPDPATPDALTKVLLEIVTAQSIAVSSGVDAVGATAIGVALPCVMLQGVIHTAANVDTSLIGFNIGEALHAKIKQPVVCLNDADAAGLAEMRLGAGRGQQGTVMMLTFGTGIGSALFSDGVLVRNTELGHLLMSSGGITGDAERRAAARVKTSENLSYEQWAERVNDYLRLINELFWPELIVVGGAISEDFVHYQHLLRSRAPIRPAQLGASAGLVGAALAAAA